MKKLTPQNKKIPAILILKDYSEKEAQNLNELVYSKRARLILWNNNEVNLLIPRGKNYARCRAVADLVIEDLTQVIGYVYVKQEKEETLLVEWKKCYKCGKEGTLQSIPEDEKHYLCNSCDYRGNREMKRVCITLRRISRLEV